MVRSSLRHAVVALTALAMACAGATAAGAAGTSRPAPHHARSAAIAHVHWAGAAGRTVKLRHLVKLHRTGHPSRWDPIANPHTSLKPKPDYNVACYEHGGLSAACYDTALQAINRARAREHVRPLRLPANFRSLSQADQVFVVTQQERVDRGLPALAGYTADLNQRALVAAKNNADPLLGGLLSGVLHWLGFVSNWAKDYNALAADYDWMYDDGYPSANYECRRPGGSGCWGHRENILSLIPGQHTIVGSSAVRRSSVFHSLAMIAVGVDGSPPVRQPTTPNIVKWHVTPGAGYRGWSMTFDHAPIPHSPQHTSALGGFLDLIKRAAGTHRVRVTVYSSQGRQTFSSPRIRIKR
jgi:hypothetical protein